MGLFALSSKEDSPDQQLTCALINVNLYRANDKTYLYLLDMAIDQIKSAKEDIEKELNSEG